MVEWTIDMMEHSTMVAGMLLPLDEWTIGFDGPFCTQVTTIFYGLSLVFSISRSPAPW